MFVEDDAVRVKRYNVGKMPVYCIPVTLAEVLEVQGAPLNDNELWAVLYATSKSLAHLFLQGSTLFANGSFSIHLFTFTFLFLAICLHFLHFPLFHLSHFYHFLSFSISRVLKYWQDSSF